MAGEGCFFTKKQRYWPKDYTDTVMHQFSSVYQGQLRTEVKHLQSGTTLITDAPTDNHGRGESFSPTDLLCVALGSCMMTLMGIYAQKHGLDLAGMAWTTEKIMQPAPRKIARIRLHFRYAGAPLPDHHIAALEEAARTCPVSLTLGDQVAVDLLFDWK